MLEYWQSLEQLSESPEVLERLAKEFPGYDPEQITSVSRRRFMKLMGASMALAGITLTGCRRWPKENLAPYSSNPRTRTPGVPEQYATVYDIGGVGHGLLVTSYDGRPIKVEGNPSHPFAQTFDGKLGAADAFAQASVLELYDPERSRSVVHRANGATRFATWEEFNAALASIVAQLNSTAGKGFALLSEASSSPTVASLQQQLLQKYPQAKSFEYEPLNNDNQRLAFGKSVRTRLMLDKADVIVSFDADILGSHPAHIRYANDWARRRRGADEKSGMNRLYIAESCLSITGAVADERLAVRSARIKILAEMLAARIGAQANAAQADLTPEEKAFLDAAAADVKRNGVVIAGPSASPDVHRLVHQINTSIGAYGKTVVLLDEPANSSGSIVDLCSQIKSGTVSSLIIIGGNPAYDAPVDLGFAQLLASVPASIHLSIYDNETSALCKWHVPKSHYLESWGDARAWDGTVSFQQPLILPLYDGISTIELLAMLLLSPSSGTPGEGRGGGPSTENAQAPTLTLPRTTGGGDKSVDARSLIQRTFATLTGNTSEEAFRRVLHDGILPESEFKSATVQIEAAGQEASPATAPSGLEIRFIADQKLLDGRFANSGWLQEIPDSLSKLTWDNAALISKKDADSLGIDNSDMIKITAGQRSLEIAAFILPGQPIGVIGLPLGYGRSRAGRVGDGVGFNTYALRTSGAMHNFAGVQVSKTGATYELAATMEHHLIDPVGFAGREDRIGKKGEPGRIIREATLAEYEKDPHAPNRGQHQPISLQIFEPPSQFNSPHAWGMTVDMNACIGCNACVVACQAENNIPIVGKHEVLNNREMHWIRIDRYFKGSADDPQPDVVFQPMMCVHCENAPCEQVCPVAATTHDSEGLNVMVYNRCIGTRYCSNNCPYKVRRFNYFDWHSKAEDNLNGAGKPWLGMPDSQQQETVNKIRRMVFNPEVTVRMRGVMEKCSYCVQRIHNTQSAKRIVGEELKDGDVVTACQQSCPTEAIVFGNLNDPEAKVTKLQKNARAYSVLDDLNTKPRTKYLAKLRNPNEQGKA